MSYIIYQKKAWKKEGGYTLLFAILVASLVLAIGISILSINKKEFLLTASARDSAAAFYAADSGLECAIRADDKGAFVVENYTDFTPILNASCNVGVGSSQVVTNYPSSATDPSPLFSFDARFGGTAAAGPCAIVTIDKTPDANENPHTVIIARGYNTGWDGSHCAALSARRVERAIKYAY